jgi:hypothetical protein
MTKVQYLKDQAARAERLARGVMDALTVERLQSFAAECRTKAEAEQRLAAWNKFNSPRHMPTVDSSAGA